MLEVLLTQINCTYTKLQTITPHMQVCNSAPNVEIAIKHLQEMCKQSYRPTVEKLPIYDLRIPLQSWYIK